jgi:hypothetical protein
LRTVRIVGDGLTCLTFCMYHPRNTFTPKVGQDS